MWYVKPPHLDPGKNIQTFLCVSGCVPMCVPLSMQQLPRLDPACTLHNVPERAPQ